ncbi:unnamed protein product [Rhizophagus irregularis]|nr:unnamed protein product [Rhizophagus irregularis]
MKLKSNDDPDMKILNECLEIERGFSKIYKAIWIDSPCCWNEEKYDFDYNNPNITVALKQLNDSEKLVIMN